MERASIYGWMFAGRRGRCAATLARSLWARSLLASTLAIPLAIVAACVVNDPGGGNGDPTNGGGGTADQVTAQIVNISATGVPLALQDPPIAVIYDVTGTVSTISGFYQPVADSNPQAGAIGDRVIVATFLPPGNNQAFNFDSQTAGVGFFRVGIIVTFDGMQLEATSDGVIQVQGPPDPMFITPASGAVVDVEPGDTVRVSFDAGDPEGIVQWRLFYVPAGDCRTDPPDAPGTQIATGSGNVGALIPFVTPTAPGDYELGLSATDSGQSVSATFTVGDLDRIVTICGATVRVTTPP